MTKSKTGKKYERIVADIHEEFSDAAHVNKDEKITGKSGRKRQIDVSLRINLVGYEVLVIIECKDYSRKVGIGKVDELIGKMEDVSANKAVLVSDSGFTQGAIDRASQDGRIDLCSVVDSSNGYLKSKIYIPLKVSFVYIKPTYKSSINFRRSEETLEKGWREFSYTNSQYDKMLAFSFINSHLFDWLENFNKKVKTEAQYNSPGVHIYKRQEVIQNLKVTLTCEFERVAWSFSNEDVYLTSKGIFNHLSKSLTAGSIKMPVLNEQEIIGVWKEVSLEEIEKLEGVHYSRISYYNEEHSRWHVNHMKRSLGSA